MFKRIVIIALVFTVLSMVMTVITGAAPVDESQENNGAILEISKVESQTNLQVSQEVNKNEEEYLNIVVQAEETVPIETLPKEVRKFGTDITFNVEYISNGEVMRHALYTPSTANEGGNIPLIVWLHGSGEVGSSKETFLKSGLLAVMNNWELEGFNCYILCPHLVGDWWANRWNKTESEDNLKALLDWFIDNYNVDTENIIIMGHSLGGQGALYMAHQLQEYFSKCVVLSGYTSGIDNSEIKIPTIGYVGKSASGEDSASESYMKKYFETVFGEDYTFFINASHGGVPKRAMKFDENENGRSDLIEWMLGDMTIEEMQIK